jgi:hypothetical protein
MEPILSSMYPCEDLSTQQARQSEVVGLKALVLGIAHSIANGPLFPREGGKLRVRCKS